MRVGTPILTPELTRFIAGQDATEVFFSLHRYEVLQRPQFSRLQIGVVVGQEQQIWPRQTGALSRVPYAEPTWLTTGYHTPYYKDVSRFSMLMCLSSPDMT